MSGKLWQGHILKATMTKVSEINVQQTHNAEISYADVVRLKASENIRKYQQLTWSVSATAEIYKLARRRPGVPTLESSDNHPTKRRNHPTDSTNLPIIYRRMSLTGDKYGRRN